MNHPLLHNAHNLVAASILAADPARLGEEALAAQSAGADWLHCDVMDGNFVPPITFGAESVKALRPYLTCIIDVHLMTEQPHLHIESFAKAGADFITFHIEADKHPYRTIQTIKKLGKKAGIALNPGTSVDAVQPLFELLDLVLVMTVNPGWGGQQFLHDQIHKISTLAKWNTQRKTPLLISADGGINASNAPLLVHAGAHVLAAGSSCFSASADDYPKNILALRQPLPIDSE